MFTLIGDRTNAIRIAWVRESLKALPSGWRILDAGAGELTFKPDCKHLEYVAQDFGKYDGGGDGVGLQTGSWDNRHLDIVSDITEIPVSDASFDAILCTEVLEHVPDAVSAIREFSRIIKPGGTLILTAPFASLTHFAPYHFCGYSRYWYEHHLRRAGFEIRTIDHNGSWFAFVAQELRRSRIVGKMYALGFLGLVTRVCAIPILGLLTLLSKYDRGSHELLCFGYMVRAEKRVN